MKNLVHLSFILFFAFFSCSSPDHNLKFVGKPVAKTIMVVDYDLSGLGSTYDIKWSIADSNTGEWSELPGIKSKEIVLLTDYVGKYVKCDIIINSGQGRGKTFSGITDAPVVYQGNPNTDWFKDAGVGVMIHFLKENYVKDGGSPEWNNFVDNFDVELFADGCSKAGAGYVLFSLGQNNGYYCSPNSVFDSVVGTLPGDLCSNRDLPMDLYEALAKRGIRMMFYLPGNPPIEHELVVEKFQYTYGVDSPTSQYTQERWEAVIREWSLRYGERLSGWWFDGMYRGGIIETRSDMSLPHNISTHTLAAKIGNFNSIVSYNYGVDEIQSNSPYDDYSAGEESQITQLPKDRWVVDGVQWFHFTYLGEWWGHPGKRFTTGDLVDWGKKVFEKEGVLCFDVYVKHSGEIDTVHIKQVAAIREVFEKSKGK